MINLMHFLKQKTASHKSKQSSTPTNSHGLRKINICKFTNVSSKTHQNRVKLKNHHNYFQNRGSCFKKRNNFVAPGYADSPRLQASTPVQSSLTHRIKSHQERAAITKQIIVFVFKFLISFSTTFGCFFFKIVLIKILIFKNIFWFQSRQQGVQGSAAPCRWTAWRTGWAIRCTCISSFFKIVIQYRVHFRRSCT